MARNGNVNHDTFREIDAPPPPFFGGVGASVGGFTLGSPE